jgi:hypothetical protein
MGTHHFNRKNMFHKVRHSTSVLIFRAYQAPHLDLPICKWGRTRKWPASLKKCGMSSSQLPQRTTPALLNGETIWNYHPESSLNYTNLHSSTNFQSIWDLPMGPRWDMRWRWTAGGVFQQFLAGVSRLGQPMVISARSPLIPWDMGWLLRSERRGWGHLVSTYFQGHRFRWSRGISGRSSVWIHRPTISKYFLNSLQWFYYSLQDTIRYYSLL